MKSQLNEKSHEVKKMQEEREKLQKEMQEQFHQKSSKKERKYDAKEIQSESDALLTEKNHPFDERRKEKEKTVEKANAKENATTEKAITIGRGKSHHTLIPEASDSEGER